MKKLLLLLTVMVIGISGVAFGQSWAQSQASADLNLSGVVPEYVNITVNTFGDATGFDLSEERTTELEVAEVTETANTGYVVTATSDNGFELVSEDDSGYSVGYTLFYAGTEVAANGDDVTTGGGYTTGTTKTVSITHSAATEQNLAGNYTDTVTFEITAQ